MQFLVVGSGFSGAVLARELVESLPCSVVIMEERDHLAGNCHTLRDSKTNILIHKYGPHIFNTNNEAVWNYVNSLAKFRPYTNRVKAVSPKGVFSLPINLLTINQFFGVKLTPATAQEFLARKSDQSILEPRNFEEQALKMIGRELYENFFYGYTKKQWGCEPHELPPSILKRLPVRFNYDDNYYDKTFQGIPEEGYTSIVENLVTHSRIQVELERRFKGDDAAYFDHTFYTGPIDAFFNHRIGRLGYRTVSFERIDAEGDYQGNPVINYTGDEYPFTRIHEHKHFAPWEKHTATVAFREYSKETEGTDIPYYPKRLSCDLRLLKDYRFEAAKLQKISFLGRLATYRYMDMEQVIAEAMLFSKSFIQRQRSGQALPVFSNIES